MKFKDFLRPYLKNEKRIIKYDKKYGRIVINLNGFETYDEFFNWEYDKNQKKDGKRLEDRPLPVHHGVPAVLQPVPFVCAVQSAFRRIPDGTADLPA